ncbi:MAG TPA: hypothetical protein VE986_05410 [Hyphomicrobiales bacterium]|nr:hypothetical protein [Hyphomicrobiales bacterium]
MNAPANIVPVKGLSPRAEYIKRLERALNAAHREIQRLNRRNGELMQESGALLAEHSAMMESNAFLQRSNATQLIEIGRLKEELALLKGVILEAQINARTQNLPPGTWAPSWNAWALLCERYGEYGEKFSGDLEYAGEESRASA